MRYLLLALGLLAIVVVAAVALPPKQTSVAVHGLIERTDLVLEVGDHAWPVTDHGVASVASIFCLAVRLVGRTDCHIYADFEAPAGSQRIIELEPDESTTLRQPEVMEAGPAFSEETNRTNCPRS